MTDTKGKIASARPKRRMLWAALAIVLLVTGLAILRAYPPADSSFYPKCILHHWTGLHCPGCGGTRALAALTHGQIGEAIRVNPLIVLGGPLLFALIAFQRWKERSDGKARPVITWGLVILFVVYSVARNVPSPTRSILAPPATPVNHEDTATL